MSQRAASQVQRTEIQTRFGDTDALGHINNVSFVAYAELGRLDFARVLGSSARSLILAQISVNFRQQVRIGMAVVVETWVERIGTTSVTLRQAILADEVVAAEVSSVVVGFDYGAQRPVPWSSEARAALEAYVRRDGATVRKG